MTHQSFSVSCAFGVHSTFEVTMEYVFDRTYYRGNRRVLKLIGQWPFQSPMKNKFLRCITLITIGSMFLPQMIKLIESTNDMDIFVDGISTVGFHTVALIKSINWAINEENMRKLVLDIERDWETLILERDIKLLEDYTQHGQTINVLYTGALFGCLAFHLSSPAMPKIMDFILPLNESRPRIFFYQTEYFIDQDEYYVYLLLHVYMTVPITMLAIVFIDNLFSIFINHTCGMLAISKIHLESLTDEESSDDPETLFERLKVCLHLQTNIIQFVNKLEASYSLALLLIVGINMAIIAMTGVVAITSLDDNSQLMKLMSFNIGTIFHLFWSSWQGHNLIVASESLFRSAYQSEWYNAPKRIQLMLLPIMMRSLEPCKITAGTMYVMSMESFGAAMRTTLSFFTLVLSVR